MLNNISLRKRITIITLIIMIILCVILTIFTLFNAQISMFNPIHTFQDDNFSQNLLDDMPPPAYGENFRVLMEDTRRNFMFYLFLTMFASIIIAAIVMYYLSGKMLKPLTDFSNQIKSIDQHNLSTRLEESNNNDEISSLSQSFNSMLSKIEQAFNYQKQFSKNAAHELKTPLTTMITNIEVLEMEDNPSIKDYQEVLDIVKESSFNLANLVNSLLKVNNKSTNKYEDIALKELIDNILVNYQDKIKEKNISIKIEGQAAICSDKVLFESVITNIIANAIRYNKQDGLIDIKMDNEKLIIKDSGIGIAQENLESIFQPFYCVDKSRSKNLGGHGLGLSIVKTVFNKLNIDYEIDSELDKGTIFMIHLSDLNNKTKTS